MSKPRLTPLEEEFLLDLLHFQEQFRSSQIAAGTMRGKVMFRMASRRGKTRPAPVHGLSEADRSFKATFTRTLNRLVKAGLVERRAVGLGDFHGLPYQWGYGRHGKRDKDIFLTAAGEEAANTLHQTRVTAEPTPPPRPRPTPAQQPTPARPSQQPAVTVPMVKPTRMVNPRVLYHYHPTPGIACNVILPVQEAGPRIVLFKHTVSMGGFDVVYEVTRSVKKDS